MCAFRLVLPVMRRLVDANVELIQQVWAMCGGCDVLSDA